MKAPSPAKLHNVEQWYYDSTTKKKRLVATIHYNKPYPLAKWLKEAENKLNKPKGTYHTIPKTK